ncbi:hypothetical protein JCM10212_004733 [Sporobolomyces blumeae]
MKTFASLTALSLVASGAHAIGIIDNVQTFVKLTTSAVELDGDYYIQNAKTGKYLYFDRPGDTTNLITGNDKTPVTLGQDSQYGQSGVKWQTWAGTYITGLSKCASSQWGESSAGGQNIAAVSYACKVGGSKDGTDSLEVAKQFWKMIPCGSSSDDDSSASSTKTFNLNANVKLAAASSSSSSSSGSSSSSSSDSSSKSSSSDDNNSNNYVASSTSSKWTPQSTQTVDKSDRTTWICRHPGWWLDRHPAYVTEAGHVECKDDLEAYRASLKKRSSVVEDGFASHARMHRKNKRALIEKRASSNRVCIVAVDHSLDMATRAITPSVIDTFGGYKSVALADYDESDESQHWIVTAA